MAQAPDISVQGSRWALVVATARYEDPGLTQLRAPARDAADMAEVLADARLGGFEVTSVLDQPEHTVRRRIDEFLAVRERDDLVVVYLSCHGVLDARGRLFFATTDTVKARLRSTAVGSAWLLEQLEECPARRQVLILDCCFSGAFGHAKGGAELDMERRLLGSGRGRVVLTASRAGEYSFEGQPLADVMDEGSVFTATLVKGLRTGDADLDQDGWVSVDDAFGYVAARVAASGLQNPQRFVHAGEGSIVLARNPRGPKVVPAGLPEAASANEDPEFSLKALEAILEMDPGLAQRTAIRTAVYERQVRQALRQAADRLEFSFINAEDEITVESGLRATTYVVQKDQRYVAVAVFYCTEKPPSIIDVLQTLYSDAATLFVLNVPVPDEILPRHPDDQTYSMTWTSPKDDAVLESSLEMLMSKAPLLAD